MHGARTSGKRLHVRLRRWSENPLVVSVCSGLIIGLIGVFITNYFAKENLEKQMRLELYKDMIHQQGEFVDCLSKSVYGRMYKLKAYLLNVRDGSSIDIRDCWNRYKMESIEWNEQLKYFLINLDRYFPADSFKIASCVKATLLFKNNPDFSFRQVLEKMIQRNFAELHKNLGVLNKKILAGQKISDAELGMLDVRVEQQNKIIYEFTEALSTASSYYKINSRRELIHEKL